MINRTGRSAFGFQTQGNEIPADVIHWRRCRRSQPALHCPRTHRCKNIIKASAIGSRSSGGSSIKPQSITIELSGQWRWVRDRAIAARRCCAAGLAKGMSVLDVGTGTGLVARQAAGIVGEPRLVTGLDPSAGMLAQAVEHLSIRVVRASAEQMPLAESSFDFLSMGYALRHVTDLAASFREFYRVLKPGGTLCLLEITRPAGRFRTTLVRWYMRSLVPLISRIASRSRQSPRLWEYYWDTIEACVPPTRVVEAIGAAGFTDVKHHVQWGLFSEYTARKSNVT